MNPRMCMIAYRPASDGKKGSNIPNAVIDTAITRHADGFGIAWRDYVDGTPVLNHAKFGPADRAQFRKLLKRIDGDQSLEYVTHFRFATHGPKDQAHAHPYEYTDPNGETVLIFHNGVIDIRTTRAESDTEVFVRDVLAQLPAQWWRSAAHRYLVGEAIGWSRLVVMTAAETVSLQEVQGEWDAGLWYSSNHRASKYTSYGTGTGVHQPYVYSPAGTAAAAAAAPKRAPVSTLPTGGAIVAVATAAESTIAVRNPIIRVGGAYTFRHAGHALTEVIPIDRTKDGDWLQSVVCDTCYTMGDVYIIDGKPYIDMSHHLAGGGVVRAVEEDDEEARLVEAVSARQARRTIARTERRERRKGKRATEAAALLPMP